MRAYEQNGGEYKEERRVRRKKKKVSIEEGKKKEKTITPSEYKKPMSNRYRKKSNK